MAEINLAVEILFEGDGTDDQFEAFIEEVAAQLDEVHGDAPQKGHYVNRKQQRKKSIDDASL